MNVEEAALLEETMRRVGQVVAHTRNSADEFGAGTQMSDLTQVLHTVLLLGERERVSRAVADDLDCVAFRTANLELDELAFRGRFDQFAFALEAGTDLALGDVLEVGHRTVNDDLERVGSTAVGEFNESKVFAAHASSACPAGHLNNVIDHLLANWGVQCGDAHTLAEAERGDGLFFDGDVTFVLHVEVAFVSGVLGAHTLVRLLLLRLLLLFCGCLGGFSIDGARLNHFRVKMSLLVKIIKSTLAPSI